MPTYRSITVSLVTQFDILGIPEYAPPKTAVDPFSNAPTLTNHDNALISVYVPILPSSQFWLSYSIAPPYPPNLFYYFKLYINGQPIVSWGCGHDDEYKGKTMFGLYDSARSLTHTPMLERRVLCFTPNFGDGRMPDSLSDVMEVKVFRSKDRKRMRPAVQAFSPPAQKGRGGKTIPRRSTSTGVELLNGGLLSRQNPQRFYQYALLDPLDQPFAIFRFYYRTWDQLDALGIISEPTSIDSSSFESTVSTQPHSPRSSSNNNNNNAPSSHASDPIPDEVAALSPIVNTLLGPTIYDTDDIPVDHVKSPDSDNHPPAIPPPLEALTKPYTFIRPPTPPSIISPIKIGFTNPPPSSTTSPITDQPASRPNPDNEGPGGPNLPPSKETFASLVRNLPSHDTNAFKLNETIKVVKAADLTSSPNLPTSSSSRSMHALRKVVDHAKGRRGGRRASEDGASTSDSDGSRERKKMMGEGGGKWGLNGGGEKEAPHGRDKHGKIMTIWDAL